ncbi:MAG TPA: hypothetical protein VMZ69_07015, partial [Saprospiraceae bacterium]|nr:hypothetical protein [Saprospiraceae bacterium]
MKWTRYVFFIFLGISLISFIPSIGSGFVFDFPGWQNAYAKGNFGDILNCFGYNGNHQFLHLIFYSFYRIFDIQGVPWYLFFCFLHAINAFLIYRLILAFSRFWNIDISAILAFSGGLIFLLHPYNVEPVVWKVCVHYLMSLMAVLLLHILLIRFIQNNQRNALWLASLIYALSLFSLEISFVTPLIVSFAVGITLIIGNKNKIVLQKGVLFAGCLWVLLAAYIFLNKITLGTFVGHHGENVHLKLDLLGMASTENKYLVKHLFYARFFSFKTKLILF